MMHRTFIRLVVCLALSSTMAAGAAPSVVVRFYPQRTLRTYEMDARRGLGDALLQNAAIVNGSGGAVTLDRVEFDLIAGDAAVQTRRLGAADLEKAAKKGAALQQGGLLEQYAFQFQPDLLLGKGVTLSPTARLTPGTALLIGHRFFAFTGAPEKLRLRAFGHFDDGTAIEAEGSLPIAVQASKVEYGFPLAGRWFIGADPAMHHHRRWVVPEEFALDIARLGDSGATHRGDGSKLSEYHAYGQEVLAAADGVVVSVEGSIPEAAAMLRQPGEAAEAYEKRMMEMQAGLLAKGYLHAAGNHVVIEHEGGEFSFYGHLLPGSLRVAKGDRVLRGQPIARLGNSGNSTEPHLHFQVTDGPDPILSAGIPVRFVNIEIPLSDGTRAVQSGDVVETR
ncbi:MAG TPA: M23 family metallopeptidase [Candidatus Polarisedimenticolia bacterium]|jgi:hypothetical protein